MSEENILEDKEHNIDQVGGLVDITQHEVEALKTEYNLADAHTHQSQSRSQQSIVSSLPEIWYESERKTQYESEQDFIKKFYTLHGQHTALKRNDEIYLVYAASIAMNITATYLMKKKMRVGLIEPCFDNLHDIMHHASVPMVPLDESILYEESEIYNNLMKGFLTVDSIFIVDPNNPTGASLFSDGSKRFLELVRFCSDYNKLLIIDTCFSAFILASGMKRIDIYEILENSGVSYIVMEDTGKTWPLQDAKCATLHASRDINDDIYNIFTSVLLNVSPFILNIVTRYVEDSREDNFFSVRDLLERNARLAKHYLEGDHLKYYEPQIKTSVAWFEIKDPEMTADRLQQKMLSRNVYVLPGKYFYWAHPERGQRFIRVALARDTKIFEKSMQVAAEVLNEQ